MDTDDWGRRIGQHIRGDGSVVIPARIAAWLDRTTGFTADRRIRLRDTDPDAYATLAAIRLAALSYRNGSHCGTKTGAPQPNSPDSEPWVDTATAARRLGISPRAVRKRAAAGRIPARRTGGRWLVRTDTY